MNIEGDKMEEFLSKSVDECMTGQLLIKINDDISFECSLYPKGDAYVGRFVSSKSSIMKYSTLKFHEMV